MFEEPEAALASPMAAIQQERHPINVLGGRLAVPACGLVGALLQTTLRAWFAAGAPLSLALLHGCGGAPPLPDDEDHRDATVDECIQCHVDGDRNPPDGHFDDGEIKAKKRNCRGCHALPE